MRKSVVTPLTLGFLIMALCMGAFLILSFWYIKQLYLDSQGIIENDISRKVAAIQLKSSVLEARWNASRYLDSGDPAYRAQAVDAYTQADRNMAILQDAVEPAEWDAFSASYQGYRALLDGMLYYSDDSDSQSLESQADAALADLVGAVTAMQGRVNERLEERLDHHNYLFRCRHILLAIGALLILFGAATGLTLGRSITQPLARLTEAAGKLGEGDLTAVPDIPKANEIGALAASFRQMATGLGQAIARMRETSAALTASAAQLFASTANLNDLARGTLTQMEQIAHGAEAQREQMRVASGVAVEIAAGLRQSAQQAGEVGQAAHGAQAQLEETARTVVVLDREATEIQNITAVIEQFARETHMLALNAAIEARRAGEAGRGFAAVSDEMRALAERSARSAGEVARFGARVPAEMESVRQAVTDVQTAVAQTAEFAGQTVEAARKHEEDTSTLASVVEQAAAVSEAHARIAGQVSAAMAQQAQAIAELVSAAQGLAGLAGQLEGLAARFVTG
jgi:methyl-accepting chemotaxis protein